MVLARPFLMRVFFDSVISDIGRSRDYFKYLLHHCRNDRLEDAEWQAPGLPGIIMPLLLSISQVLPWRD